MTVPQADSDKPGNYSHKMIQRGHSDSWTRHRRIARPRKRLVHREQRQGSQRLPLQNRVVTVKDAAGVLHAWGVVCGGREIYAIVKV